jgi:hypothetical protein
MLLGLLRSDFGCFAENLLAEFGKLRNLAVRLGNSSFSRTTGRKFLWTVGMTE